MMGAGQASQPRSQHMYTLRHDARSAIQRQAEMKMRDGKVLFMSW